jgi:GAF domain-containing protein
MYTKLYTEQLNKNNSLLQAIDFFTQKFNLNQLSSYAFEFTNQILNLGASALFIKEDGLFKLVKIKGYCIEDYAIADNSKLQSIATLHGNVMTSGFESYFEVEDIEKFNARLIIPLIIKDLLYGFIISEGKEGCCLNEEDMLMSKALMQLINNSLESSKNLADLQLINKQLDQKIFNLFSINHSSRMLLSELDLSRLYSLAIDIFSELTSSRVTSFGLYDDIKDRIVIRGYKDVFSSEKYYGDFELADNNHIGYKVVFHYQDDKEELKRIFKNYDDFRHMDVEHIILLVKEKVLGFVTISKPINDRAYDQSLFELIESLAASTFISFKNAMYFNEVDRQKKSTEQKLHILTNLNTLIRNINSCTSLEELCDVAIKTLHYGFNIKKAFIALKEKDSYIIKNHAGFELSDDKLITNEKWGNINKDTFVSFMNSEVPKFISESLLADVGPSNCLVISPISIDNLDIEGDGPAMGYVVVLLTQESLKEEEVLLIETLCSSISPVINHLQTVKQIKQEYIANEREAFVTSLRTKLFNRDKYNIDFYIYYKNITHLPFENPDLTRYSQQEHYYFDNMLLVLSYAGLYEEDFDGSIEPSSEEEVIDALKKAYKYKHKGGQ